ncbi:MAG TPA: arginine repressor [Vicinamibacterales bacterium]|jgi:transcriptional regulator of arginine metabolism
MKQQRQAAILDLVGRKAIHSQEQLRRRLRVQGFDVTQATLSRDIRDLGLVKRAADSAYQRPQVQIVAPPSAEVALQRAMGEYASGVDRVQQLVVVRTGPGQANALAQVIDRAQLPDVVGTLAGDDTILVVSRDGKRARALERALKNGTKE